MIRAGTMVGTITLMACVGQLAVAQPVPLEAAAPLNGEAVFAAQVAPRQSLDLRAPDIATLFTPEEISRILAQTDDRSIEEVEVQGVRGRTGPIPLEGWSGAGAPLWALLRLIGPQPVYARNDPPDTTGYLPPAAAHASAALGWN